MSPEQTKFSHMLAPLLSLLLLPLASAADPLACENRFNRERALCVKEACPSTSSQAVDKKHCQHTCQTIAESETKLAGGCSMYQPAGKYEAEHGMPRDLRQKANAPIASLSSPQSKNHKQAANPQSDTSSQTQAHEQASNIASEGEKRLQQEQTSVSGVRDTGKKLQNESISRNQRLIGSWEKELASGKSQNFPPSRAKLENDRKLNQQAEKKLAQNEPFSREKANQATHPAIRSNLIFSSRGQELESKAGAQLANIAAALAQLVGARQTAEANGTALDSAPPSQSFRPGTQVTSTSPRTAEGAKGSANISAGKEPRASEDEEVAAEKTGEKNTGGFAATADLRGRLRARLRELMRKRANGSATPEEITELAKLDSEEVPDAFLGDLGAPRPASGLKKADDPFLSALSKNIFGMSGSETDATINRLHKELTGDELEFASGVLPSESLSLFERIKAAHDACAARNCVIPGDQMVASRR